MNPNRRASGRRARPRSVRVALLVAVMAAASGPMSAAAHEGHAALPTKGATVQGNQLLLSAKARQALGLETAKVALGDLRRVIRARARVELPWSQQAMITTLVPGRIERVLVRPGEPVKAGQELARVQSLELEDFQRDLLRADAELDLAGRILEQREGLGRADAIAQVEVLESRHERDEAAAQVVIATQKLLALGLDGSTVGRVRATKQPLGMLPITSPIDGVISHADVRTGQVVAPDEHLYHVVDASKISIVAEVLESDVAAVRAGQAIRAEFSAPPGTTVVGDIDHVHPALDPRTRTREAVAHVANPGGALRPGLTGRVEVEIERIEQAIVCPARALIDAPGGPFVLLRRGEDRFERRKVVPGLLDGDSVEVRGGLFPGDRVVVVGKQLLAAMFHVDSKAEGSPTQASVRSPGPPGSLATDLHAPGVVAQGTVELPTRAKYHIAPRIEGRLAKIRVEPGQRVEAGQVMAEVDSLTLRNLQLELLHTRLEHEWTRAAVDRLRALVPRAGVARRQLWERESELVVLETELAALRAKLRAVGLPAEVLRRLEEAGLATTPEAGLIAATIPLVAPAAGVVAHFEVVPGQVVRPSDTLFEVHDPSRVWIKGYVFERDAAAVRIGDGASVTFPSLPGRTATGVVVRIAPLFDPGERVLPVWVEVENPDGLLPEGAQARMTFASKRPSGDRVARRDRRWGP